MATYSEVSVVHTTNSQCGRTVKVIDDDVAQTGSAHTTANGQGPVADGTIPVQTNTSAHPTGNSQSPVDDDTVPVQGNRQESRQSNNKELTVKQKISWPTGHSLPTITADNYL